MPEALELTVLMPCLNEAETLGTCISKAKTYLETSGIAGEILVADNGSTDGSREIAAGLGARVVDVPRRGYGAALLAGIVAARGRYVIMGDADDSYDFGGLAPFVAELRRGAELVMGNRFVGGIDPGAMPFLHRYLGNPVLTLIGRILFRIDCGDFHCGLRGFARDRILALKLHSSGMEFASEMIIRAGVSGLRIVEVPTTLAKDGRSRPPHLRTWQDGWRHLRLLLVYSPRWLFLYPGIAMIALGIVASLALLPGPLQIAKEVYLGVTTFLVACMSIVIGVQSITFGILARRRIAAQGLLPASTRYGVLIEWLTLERMLAIALAVFACGAGGMVWSLYSWGAVKFGPLDYEHVIRVVGLSLTMIVVAVQFGLAAFLASVIDIRLSDGDATE